MSLLGPEPNDRKQAEFVLGLVSKTYDHSLHPFFRGSVISSRPLGPGQLGYLVKVQRPEGAAPDGMEYLCLIPGYVPSAGDVVDCMWRDARTGYVFAVLQSASTLGVPTGSINAFAGAAAPGGWLICDGSAVSRTTYANLFAVLASTYGAGDGSTTFNLPDMRGRAPIGAGTGTGLTARVLAAKVGEENHALSIAEMPSHNHAPVVAGLPLNIDAGAGTTDRNVDSAGLTGAGGNMLTPTAQGGNGTHNNMPPSIALNFIVKA